ncbi:hypothetical protein CAPTEDRAFT_183936 [Capitella teleta]|uniref:CNH domain-containing protein n=1 Tax=Capitella teleta TaxID=283909 RepID=R7UXU6_CAPTE|nr:hypothetical protein CAPTEDRAFT_183936 [Capitella teleta]|eukprot:ELU08757.1 hypothetical protein CAPTEDRAFT_183936 [Capitella teleta]
MSIKAFELVPAIERFQLMSERALTKIVCIESCGKNIYIGTDDCFVVHYLMEEQTNQQTGKMTFTSQKIGHKYLGVKKPVLELKSASALNRLMILCDSTLSMMNMMDLEPVVGGAKIRAVTSFCVNAQPLNNSPFSVEICVALKRKSLQVYLITEDRIQLMKDISTSSPPISMALTGEHLCFATSDLYSIINIQTSQTQELFTFDESLKPTVTNISRGEFLLSAPSALGMFAMANGMSQRPPLRWSDNLLSVAYYHPYVLALNDEFVTIHSVLDQQQKQSLPFKGGCHLGHFDGRLFVASGRDVYALVPVPVQKQLQNLLSLQRVHEALDLARSALKTGALPTAAFQRIQLQVGFIEFAAQNFEEARQLFLSASLDVRELISLYPNMLPPTCPFTRQIPPLHDMADIVQVAQKDHSKICIFQEFLLEYLKEIDASSKNIPHKQEVHSALLKLYAELNPAALPAFIQSDRLCHSPDCIEHLKKHGCHHAIALLHCVHGDNTHALKIWTQIVDGELQDDSFPGFNFIVDFITKLKNETVVWENIDWLLEQDESMAVQVLISNQSSKSADKFHVDGLLERLSGYPIAMKSYLEFLVLEKELPVERFHTHLSVLYLDDVLQLMNSPTPNAAQIESARKKLQHLLQMSNLYRVQLILGKVKQTELYTECAILYAKLEEHDKALRLLVHKVKDYKTAEMYCLVNSSADDLALRGRLFHLLLSLYLDSNHERHESLVGPAIDLLNRNRHYFNTAKVLEMIPDNWSVGLLSHFLTSSIRQHLHQSRTVHLHRMLSRTHHLQLKSDNIRLDSAYITLKDDVLCSVCGRDFTDPSFARYPNGVIAHISCITSKHVCPVTGKLFGTAPTSSPSNQHSPSGDSR